MLTPVSSFQVPAASAASLSAQLPSTSAQVTVVDGAPAMLKTDMKKEDAEALKKSIEEAGGKVTFK